MPNLDGDPGKGIELRRRDVMRNRRNYSAANVDAGGSALVNEFNLPGDKVLHICACSSILTFTSNSQFVLVLVVTGLPTLA